MKVTVMYKNGKQEIFNSTGLSINGTLDIDLSRKINRLPDKHPVKNVDIKMSTVMEINIKNE